MKKYIVNVKFGDNGKISRETKDAIKKIITENKKQNCTIEYKYKIDK